MNVHRVLGIFLASAASGFICASASAQQTYPSKPIRLVVPWPAGGVVDITARLIGPGLRDRLDQPVLIVNLAGAAGTSGTEQVVKSPPDGYTLILYSSHTSNVDLVREVPYDWVRDLTPIAPVATATNLLVAHPSLPATSVEDLIRLARSNPGKITVASAGDGSASHLAAELFMALANISMLHVPYKGAAPAITDLIGGQVSIFFPPLPVALPHAQAKRVVILGITSARRSPLLPNVPAIAEALPGYEADQWLGIFGPAGTPPEVIERVNRATNEAISVQKLRDDYAMHGLAVLSGTPEDLRKVALADRSRMETATKAAGITARK